MFPVHPAILIALAVLLVGFVLLLAVALCVAAARGDRIFSDGRYLEFGRDDVYRPTPDELADQTWRRAS